MKIEQELPAPTGPGLWQLHRGKPGQWWAVEVREVLSPSTWVGTGGEHVHVDPRDRYIYRGPLWPDPVIAVPLPEPVKHRCRRKSNGAEFAFCVMPCTDIGFIFLSNWERWSEKDFRAAFDILPECE